MVEKVRVACRCHTIELVDVDRSLGSECSYVLIDDVRHGVARVVLAALYEFADNSIVTECGGFCSNRPGRATSMRRAEISRSWSVSCRRRSVAGRAVKICVCRRGLDEIRASGRQGGHARAAPHRHADEQHRGPPRLAVDRFSSSCADPRGARRTSGADGPGGRDLSSTTAWSSARGLCSCIPWSRPTYDDAANISQEQYVPREGAAEALSQRKPHGSAAPANSEQLVIATATSASAVRHQTPGIRRVRGKSVRRTGWSSSDASAPSRKRFLDPGAARQARRGRPPPVEICARDGLEPEVVAATCVVPAR